MNAGRAGFHTHRPGKGRDGAHHFHVAHFVTHGRFEIVGTDIECAERGPAQIIERGEPATELVEGQPNTDFEQFCQRFIDHAAIAAKDRLVQLQFKPGGREICLAQNVFNQIAKAIGRELDGGNLDCKPDGLRPSRRRFAGLAQSPFTDWNDQTAAFCNGQEGRWLYPPAIRIDPAILGLKTNHAVSFDRDDRLVFQSELTVLYRCGKIFLHPLAQIRVMLEIQRVEAKLAPAPVFRCVQRQIGCARQFLTAVPVEWGNCNPDRTADCRPAIVERIGLRQHGNDLLGNLAQLSAIINVRHQHLKFVSAQPADFALPSGGALKALCHLLQQLIACGMAQSVIDLFEMVQIEHEQRAGSLGIAESGQGRIDPHFHAVTVGKPG